MVFWGDLYLNTPGDDLKDISAERSKAEIVLTHLTNSGSLIIYDF